MDLNEIGIGDIVAFSDGVDHIAGVFCKDKGITGRIIRRDQGMFVVDTGFTYEVFARPEHLKLIAAGNEIPEPLDVGN